MNSTPTSENEGLSLAIGPVRDLFATFALHRRKA